MSEELVPLRKNTKKGLGRGLGSLLGELESATPTSPVQSVEALPSPTQKNSSTIPTVTSVSADEKNQAHIMDRIFKIPIEKIAANKEQPRKHFDPIKLQELSLSIKEKGIILPLIVRQMSGGNYQIIAGERRWRAAQLAGLHEVPALFRPANENEVLELALIENIQRHDLNPMEEAEGYGILVSKYGLTQNQVAERMGKDRTTVANLLRLLNLHPQVRELVKTGEILLGQAKIILGVTDIELQILLAKKAAKQKLSVRALERLIDRYKKGDSLDLQEVHTGWDKKQIEPIIGELQKMLGTKVEITPIGKGGKVAFYFYSTHELNQFMEKLRKSKT